MVETPSNCNITQGLEAGSTWSWGSRRRTGLVAMRRATLAKCSVAVDCSSWWGSGARHASIVVCAAESRPSARSLVSVESRNGTCSHTAPWRLTAWCVPV